MVSDSFPLKGCPPFEFRLVGLARSSLIANFSYPKGSAEQPVSPFLHALQVGYRHTDTALAFTWELLSVKSVRLFERVAFPEDEFFIVTYLWVPIPTISERNPVVIMTWAGRQGQGLD